MKESSEVTSIQRQDFSHKVVKSSFHFQLQVPVSQGFRLFIDKKSTSREPERNSVFKKKLAV